MIKQEVMRGNVPLDVWEKKGWMYDDIFTEDSVFAHAFNLDKRHKEVLVVYDPEYRNYHTFYKD